MLWWAIRKLKSSDPQRRLLALADLAQYKRLEAVGALCRSAQEDSDAHVRNEAERLLSAKTTEELAEIFGKKIDQGVVSKTDLSLVLSLTRSLPTDGGRKYAVHCLIDLYSVWNSENLFGFLCDAAKQNRTVDPAFVDHMVSFVQERSRADDDFSAADNVVLALGLLGAKVAAPLCSILPQAGRWTAPCIALALGFIGDPAAVPVLLCEAMHRRDKWSLHRFQHIVLIALARLGDSTAIQKLGEFWASVPECSRLRNHPQIGPILDGELKWEEGAWNLFRNSDNQLLSPEDDLVCLVARFGLLK